MEASGIKSMTEIGALTPGVEFDFFSDFGAGVYTNVSIRGVNDRNGTTVGVFLDDTPMPAPATWGGQFGRAYPVVRLTSTASKCCAARRARCWEKAPRGEPSDSSQISPA